MYEEERKKIMMTKERDYCNESELKMQQCRLKQFEKINYFYGQLMRVSDFQQEQNYLNEKRHLINRLVLGSGIICGLEVCEVRPKGEECYRGADGDIRMVSEGWEVSLSIGTALDCLGQEIVVSKGDQWWRVAGNKSPEQLDNKFGLYLKRKDDGKSPVPSSSVASSCEEACCYSRIEENFELVFDFLPDIAQLTFDASSYSECDSAKISLVEPKQHDTVTEPESRTVILKYVDKNSNQWIEKPTDINHKLDLNIANVFTQSIDLNEDIQIKSGSTLLVEYQFGERILRSTAYIRAFPQSESYHNHHQKEPFPKLKKEIAQNYYELWLKECICCPDPQDPKVLLAVLSKREQNQLEIDKDLTTWYRDIVYNNRMLYDLISLHMLDKKNPHEVTAEQVGALKRINGIGNQDAQCLYVPEITLQEGDNIKIDTVDNQTIRIAAPSGFPATSGLLTFALRGQQLRIEGPFQHHAVGDNITPPAIILGEEALDCLFRWGIDDVPEEQIKNTKEFLNSRIYTKIKIDSLEIKPSEGQEKKSMILKVSLQNGDNRELRVIRDEGDETKATLFAKEEGKTLPLIVCTTGTRKISESMVCTQKQPQTVKYMEDLSLFFLLDRFTNRDNKHQYISKGCFEKSELRDLFTANVSDGEEKHDPFQFVFFKAVDITPTDFCVLLVNYSQDPTCLTIRWHANPAVEKNGEGHGTQYE